MNRTRVSADRVRGFDVWHTQAEAMRLLWFRHGRTPWVHVKAVRRWVKVFDGQKRVLVKYERRNGGVWI